MTTTDRLRELGRQARNKKSTPVHNCVPISQGLADLCREESIPAEAHERALGEKHITHYVVMLSAAEVADIDTSTGAVFVDPTVDQFSLTNWRRGVTSIGLGRKEDLPTVGIYPPRCEERALWYHRK